MIYRSLIKYGYSNFKLEILGYCEIDVVIERELYYLDRFKPPRPRSGAEGSSASNIIY